jgi:hypothetical protein
VAAVANQREDPFPELALRLQAVEKVQSVGTCFRRNLYRVVDQLVLPPDLVGRFLRERSRDVLPLFTLCENFGVTVCAWLHQLLLDQSLNITIEQIAAAPQLDLLDWLSLLSFATDPSVLDAILSVEGADPTPGLELRQVAAELTAALRPMASGVPLLKLEPSVWAMAEERGYLHLARPEQCWSLDRTLYPVEQAQAIAADMARAITTFESPAGPIAVFHGNYYQDARLILDGASKYAKSKDARSFQDEFPAVCKPIGNNSRRYLKHLVSAVGELAGLFRREIGRELLREGLIQSDDPETGYREAKLVKDRENALPECYCISPSTSLHGPKERGKN